MRSGRAVALACLATFGTIVALAAAPAGALGITATKRAVATGHGGAVASDTLQATRAGLKILNHGGSAADAAVAVASTLGVTDPFVAGIGGGGYFVYYDARTHRVYTIDGRETAPAADTSSLFIDPSTGQPLSFPTAVTSGLSVGVPGTLMTWQRALGRWGRFTLADDLGPAARVAKNGFRVTPTLREQVRENAFRFDQFSSTSALFLPHGQLPVVGSIMKNPALARTYALIAEKGVGVFYGGAIGRDVVHTVHNLPLAPGATLVPRPGADDAGRPVALPGPGGRAHPRQLPRLRRVLDGALLQRRHDRGRVAEHPVELQPGRREPGRGPPPLPRGHTPGLRRPQPLHRRSPLRPSPADRNCSRRRSDASAPA